jgi:LysM repeat protein
VNQVTGALTKKYGPLPGYAWAGIAAVAVWLAVPFLKKLTGGSSSSTTTPGVPSQPAGAVSYGYPNPGPPGPTGAQGDPGAAGAPGAPGTNAAPNPSPPPAASQPQYRQYTIVSGDTLWGIAQKFLGNGSRWPEIYRASHLRSGDPNLIFPGEVVNVPIGGGMGGASSGRSIGNRRAQLMSPHHPDLKNPVRTTQTVAAVGGPANHVANVHAVAARAGVHPARLMALNPHYSGVIRIH